MNGAIDLAVARFGETVDLDSLEQYRDYYWHLPIEVAFSMAAEPEKSIDAGQTSDDLEELAEMTASSDDQVLWHSLAHLAELLRLLAFLDWPQSSDVRTDRSAR
jgi:hypothetical protein